MFRRDTARAGLISLVIALAAGFILPGAASAQRGAPGGREEIAIDDATKAAIVDSISRALEEVYVFPDVAREMKDQLRHNVRTGAYRDIGTYQAFAERLTEDLYAISKDRHLHVDYYPETRVETANRDSLAAEEQRQRRERLRMTNYGFKKLEHLAGNIGYLELTAFADAAWAGEIAVAAMAFLSGSDAVIIDLRTNGGGNPSMIQLISSYFFEEPVHLNSFYIRDEDWTKQFWSQAYVEGQRMADVDLYVLVSPMTFSAAEEFTYNMKNLERATIIGQTTGGGAHPTRFLGYPDLKVSLSLPYGRAVNPISGTNWEGTGVQPDIEVPQADALKVAHLEALKNLSEKAADGETREAYEWYIRLLGSRMKPAEVDPGLASSYAGAYGPRHVIFEDGELFYEREGRPRLRMIPASETLFVFDEYDFFMLEVELDSGGYPVALVGHYEGGHTDRNERSD